MVTLPASSAELIRQAYGDALEGEPAIGMTFRADKDVDGRFELYKTTAKHEGPVGRKEHGFPEELEA